MTKLVEKIQIKIHTHKWFFFHVHLITTLLYCCERLINNVFSSILTQKHQKTRETFGKNVLFSS